MSDRSRKSDSRQEVSGREVSDRDGVPLYSHIRELSPQREVGDESASPDESREGSGGVGFFAQAARISMGTAFPALRSVARFLTLESYRSLPKHDRLPDLDQDFIETDLDEILEQPGEQPSAPAGQLLDWDELDLEELSPTPYQRYLFDVRIQAYLRETKAQLSALLL